MSDQEPQAKPDGGASVSTAGLGGWGPPPTSPGLYFVWQPGDCWPCAGRVLAVEVESYSARELCAWVPFMDYSDRLAEDTWEHALWCGPVTRPDPPNVEVVGWKIQRRYE